MALVALAAIPVGAAVAAPATAISMGADFVCAVVAGGEVECWGDNFVGELGNGLTDADFSPIHYHVVGLTGVVALGTQGQDVEGHTCALITGGAAKCWGPNNSGDLGDGTTTLRLTPVSVAGLTGATQIGAGLFHSCALIGGGTVECWGGNGDGQLGNGTQNPSPSPSTVPGLTHVAQLGVGFTGNCAVLESGGLDCWGDNQWGTIATGMAESDVPTAVPGVSGAKQVSVGIYHSCATLSDGQVMCWGEDGEGQLGNGGYKFIEEVPTFVSGITDAVQVAVGQDHSCALLADGTLECWGSNASGQLGVTDPYESSVPVPVPGLSGVVEVAAAREATCALLGDGEVVCWGGEFGRLPATTAAPGGGGAGGSDTPPATGGGPTGAGGNGSATASLPRVQITAHPPRESADQTAVFKFTGTTGGAYQCSIDAGAWDPCDSGDSFGPLQPGDHRFEVRESLNGATSAAASYSWTVDLPKACIIKVARARVFAFTHQDKARLVIHYKAYKPAHVTVSYSLKNASGSLGLGTATAHFRMAGIFRLGERLDEAEVGKLKATTSMKVRFSIPDAPTSCARYYTKRLTIPKKVFGQTVWFQSDSIFGAGARSPVG